VPEVVLKYVEAELLVPVTVKLYAPALSDADEATCNEVDTLAPGERLRVEEVKVPLRPVGRADKRLNVEAVQALLSALVTVTV
jgi:hypothetical protein